MSEDLFSEVFEERAAIHEHEGGLDRETAERMATASTEAFRHSCEVRSVAKLYRVAFEVEADIGGDLSECKAAGKKAVDGFLAQVAKHRGQSSADRMRADALAVLKNN